MTKYTRYIVKFKGKPEVVTLLTAYVQEAGYTLGEARKLRRAVEDIFGNDVSVGIISLTRPDKPQARRL